MTILNILTVDNDSGTLSNSTMDLTKAEILSHEIQTLIEDMMDTCHNVEGLGLAACQVASPYNLCIYKEPGTKVFKVLINPVIIGKTGKMTSRGEGCLSLPEQYFNVKRFKKIIVEGFDRNGDPIRIKTKSKQLAKILQHEIDHLHGTTIADKGKRL